MRKTGKNQEKNKKTKTLPREKQNKNYIKLSLQKHTSKMIDHLSKSPRVLDTLTANSVSQRGDKESNVN